MSQTSKNQKTRVRSRNWCFTAFGDENFEKVWTQYSDIIRYIGWATETCPKTKKIHQQGWIQMINPKDFGVVKRLLGDKVHLEKCKGSEHQNQAYISKQNNPTTFGTFVSQGHRSDLEAIKKMIDNGGTMYQVAQDHFGSLVRYGPGLMRYRQLVQQEQSKKFRDVNVELYSGSTGTGKTRAAMNRPDVFKIQGDAMQWWDGYDGETNLVIDEYDNQIPCTQLLGILDGYQLRLPIKGGFTYARWRNIYITTNNEHIHMNAKLEHQEALDRRIDKRVNFGEN